MSDPYDLARFVDAQDAGGTWDRAVGELRRGRKTSHWMWFVFPQVAGLGTSATSVRYAVTSLDEAVAYLAHPVLGPRLLETTAAVAALEDTGAVAVLGPVDAGKLRSSMTLFRRAAPDEPLFARVLDRWYGGEADPATERRL